MPARHSGLFEALGGLEGCRKLAAAFYAGVDHDPVLRPLYSPSLKCPTENIALFLAQFVGGPCEYSKERWSLSLREVHQRFKIGRAERDAWLKNMRDALMRTQLGESERAALVAFFENASAYLMNQPPEVRHEIDCRWAPFRAIESIVEAVRAGDPELAIDLIEGSPAQECFRMDRAAWLSVLALMGGSASPVMLDYAQRRIGGDTSLIGERYTYDRTLLHGAASAGATTFAEFLLRLGANANAQDRFGHTALYAAANSIEPRVDSEIVRALIGGGADVNKRDHVKRCAALHMAARRGNVKVAHALLDCGADIEIRDIAGDTSLRRAVNCSKLEVVALLLARGADIHSVGSRGKTPLDAARGPTMKQLLQAHRDM